MGPNASGGSGGNRRPAWIRSRPRPAPGGLGPNPGRKGKGGGGGGGGGGSSSSPRFAPPPSALAAVPASLGRLAVRSLLGATVALYLLNQRHLLPKPLSSVVSRTLFWPTLPITVSSRVGRWMTPIDDAVVLGGAPFGFAGLPERLLEEHGVRSVVNLCDEYRGPTRKYGRLGMTQLRLRTVDHFEPSVADLKRAVAFIEEADRRGDRTYIHCRAGHGRSAAVVMAWLLYKNPDEDPERLNAWLVGKRNVRKALWTQPNIREFHAWLLREKDGDEYEADVTTSDEWHSDAGDSDFSL